MFNDCLYFKDGKSKAFTFSFDDGNAKDKRLIQLFNKYGIKGTFNLNTSWMPDVTDNDHIGKNEIKSVYEGHEVAVHTMDHPFLERLPVNVATAEIINDRDKLEKMTGRIVKGMAFPFGTYNSTVVEIMKSCGIKYCRSCETTARPFDIPSNWLIMPSTCHQTDSKLFEYADKFITGNPFERWTNVDGWLFYVWGHSFEFRTEEDWDRIEKFCSIISGKDDVWYATNIEICEYVQAVRALEYSVDMTKVRNPSGIDVWIGRNGKVIKVGAGCQMEIK